MITDCDLERIKGIHPGYITHWIYEEHDRPILLIARYDYYGKKTYRQFNWEGIELKEGMPQAPYPLTDWQP